MFDSKKIIFEAKWTRPTVRKFKYSIERIRTIRNYFWSIANMFNSKKIIFEAKRTRSPERQLFSNWSEPVSFKHLKIWLKRRKLKLNCESIKIKQTCSFLKKQKQIKQIIGKHCIPLDRHVQVQLEPQVWRYCFISYKIIGIELWLEHFSVFFISDFLIQM